MATSQHRIMRCSFLALALLAGPITCSHPSASDSQHHTYETSLRWRKTGKHLSPVRSLVYVRAFTNSHL